jgi:hypothetical protein
MDTNRDRQLAGLVLFFLGGLAGTSLALRWARRGDRGSLGSTLQGVHAALDETVDAVESSVSYVRRIAGPLHDLVEEANALAAGVQRTVDSYRQIRGGNGGVAAQAGFVPSAAPEGTPSGAGPS